MDAKRWSMAVAIGMSGCTGAEDPELDGQFGEEDTRFCVEIARTALGPAEVAANGVSPQQIVDAAVGSHAATLTWVTGADAALTLDVASPRDAAWVEYETSGSTDLGGLCPAMVEVTVDVALATDDGALAEAITGTLALAEPGDLSWRYELEAPTGTFDPADYAPQPYERLWAWIDVTFAGGSISGFVEGQGEATEEPVDTGSDGSVSATMFDIASF